MHTAARTFALALLACCSLAAAAHAQLVGPGLTWIGSAGGNAGSYVPSCTNLPVAAVRGENVAVRVWGDQNAPFALFAAPSATRCTPLPGIGNALMLDAPIVMVAGGVLSLTSPCLVCPPGYALMQFTVPMGVPSGAMMSLQALSMGGRAFALTVAITATVQ